MFMDQQCLTIPIRPKVHDARLGHESRTVDVPKIGDDLRIPGNNSLTKRINKKTADESVTQVQNGMAKRSQRLQLRTDGTNKGNSQHPCGIDGGKGNIQVVINKENNISFLCNCDFLQSAIVGWKTRTDSEMLEIIPHREVKSRKPIDHERKRLISSLLILKRNHTNSMSSSHQRFGKV